MNNPQTQQISSQPNSISPQFTNQYDSTNLNHNPMMNNMTGHQQQMTNQYTVSNYHQSKLLLFLFFIINFLIEFSSFY